MKVGFDNRPSGKWQLVALDTKQGSKDLKRKFTFRIGAANMN